MNYNGQGPKTNQNQRTTEYTPSCDDVIVKLKDLELKFHVIIDVDSGLLTIEDVQLPRVSYLIKAGFAGLPLADHGQFP